MPTIFDITSRDMRGAGRRRAGLTCVLLILAAFAAPVSLAASPPQLYAAETILPERPDADPEEIRNDAYSRALARVLVRVTGQRNVASRPEAAPLLEAAAQFVQQFTNRTSDSGAALLWVAFDGPSVERAASSVGLPVWNRDRPATLVWLIVDRGDGRRDLVGADSDDPARANIEATARERGIPLIWPLLDSSDRAVASAADMWGGFSDKVAAASQRYRADVVLLVRLRARPGQAAYGSWDVRTGAESDRWRANAATGIHQLADYLVSRLAASAEIASITSITVSNVYSVEAYSNVVNYLERLTVIDRVQLRAAQDDILVFDADVRGDSGQLRRAIDVGRLLTSDPDDPMGLSFRYAR